MATNNRPLKSFIRYDGSGRAVSSSLIWRKNKPKVGNWKEVQGYECCDATGCDLPPIPLSFNLNTINLSQSLYFKVNCSTTSPTMLFIIAIEIPTPATPLQVLNNLNTWFSWFGEFTLNGTIIEVSVNGNLAKGLCPDGELSFSIVNAV